MKVGKASWWQHIKFRILAFGILMSIIPVIFIFLVTFNTVSFKLKEKIRDQNFERASAIATQVKSTINSIAGNLRSITHINAATLVSENSKEQERILNIILRQEPYLENIRIIDKNLSILTEVSRVEVISDVIRANFTYIHKDITFENYDISNVFFSKDRRPKFYITVGIQDPHTRQQIGYLQAKADLKGMINQYVNTPIGNAGYVFFVDEKGYLIGHTDFSKVLRQENLRENPAVRSFLNGEELPDEYICQQGEKVIGRYAGIEKPNWGVFIEQPVGEAYEPIYALMKKWMIILILTITGVTLLSIVFGLKLVRPIEELEALVKKIRLTGNLQANISFTTKDEIGRLAYSFKQLMTMLNEKNQNIKAEKELFRTVVDGIGAGMILLSASKTIIWWNPTFAEWFGDRNYLNLSCGDVMKSEKEIDCLFLESGRISSFNLNGEPKYLRQMYYQIPRDNSEGAEYLVLLEDVTQQVEMESRVIETDKMAALGLLASGIAHEINNPLAIVSAYSEDLLDRLNEEPSKVEPDEIKESLIITSEQVVRCKQITDGLLNFSRKRRQEYDLLDIGVASSQIITLLEYKAKQKNITFTKRLSPGLYVKGNENEWQQVVLNILSNALDASPANNQVEIESWCKEGIIYFVVRDHGLGIPQSELKNVFNPFFTTKPVGQGTGLGLFVSYGIVQRMSGRLTIESNEGKGTSVIISLPSF